MKWLKHMFGRTESAEVHVQPDVQFLGEQDGQVEQDIKARWTPILAQSPSVQRAYLAIVSYDRAATYQPALCITHSLGDDPALVEALSEPFRRIFNTSQALDILFLRPEQEAQVRRVCRAFYDAA
jgi:hypothetical protein